MILKIRCAWCGLDMGEKNAPGAMKPELTITHSICRECKTKLEEETEQILQQSQQTSNQ